MTAMISNEPLSTIFGLALALGSVPVILPLTMLGGLRRKLGHVTVMVGLAVLSIATYGLAAWDATRSLWSLPLPMLALAGAYGLSEAISRVARSLAGEALKTPAAVARPIKRASMGSWFIRIAIALAMIVDIAVMYGTGGASITLQLAFAAALAACVLAGLRGRTKYVELSAVQHQEELMRFVTWSLNTQTDIVIHVPDGSAATLALLKLLLKDLAGRGLKAGLLCRGRKTFAAVSAIWRNAWLVRTSRDLDDFAVPPIKRCLHLPVGTTAAHMVSLHQLRQIMVDIGGKAVLGDTLPKQMRMYDEIWMRGAPSAALVAEAAEYGITITRLDPQPVFLTRVPKAEKRTFGLILPADGDVDQDLAYFETVVPAIEAAARAAGAAGIRLVLACMGRANGQNADAIRKALEVIFGQDNIIQADTVISVLNWAPEIFEGPWMTAYAAQAEHRRIIRLDAAGLPYGAVA